MSGDGKKPIQTANNRLKLLLVAYDFPPINSAGMHRVTCIAKYLGAIGWDISVITVRNSFVQKSQLVLQYIPKGVHVERTRCFEFQQITNFFARKIRGQTSLEAAERSASNGTEALLKGGRRGASWTRILGRIDRLLGFPDRRVGWFVPLLFRAGRLLRRNHFDVVLSSSPPHSSHLPLLILRSLIRFRWVVDFRDPWTAPPRGYAEGVRLRIRRCLERMVLRKADIIICNTPGNKDAILNAFREIEPSKIAVITNGFDEERVENGHGLEDFRLDCDFVYTGYLYREMLDTYVNALRLIVKERVQRVPTLYVFGKYPTHLHLEPELQPHIVYKGRVSYEQSLWIMRHAKALLFLIPHGADFETWVPSKLYPYIFSSRPIFALVPPGDAANIIASTRTGAVVHDTDPRTVAEALRVFLSAIDQRPSQHHGDQNEMEAYSWKTLSQQFDKTLRHGATAGP